MMKKIIIDCSIVIKWFSRENEEHSSQAKKLFCNIFNEKVIVLAPELLLYELINVLIHAKKFTTKEVMKVVQKIRELQVHFLPITKDTEKNIIRLCSKYKLTSYDASYLAVAIKYKAPLYTCDKDLLKIQGKRVTHIAEY